MVADKATNASDIEDGDDDLDEEPGEVIESTPPLEVGEEREINSSGLKKKLLKPGLDWETPEFGDEVTVHYEGTLLDGTKFVSTRDRYEPFNFKLGRGQVVTGLDNGIITMKKGEIALFTLPPEVGSGMADLGVVPPNSVIQFEVELISWITVVNICKDGGLIKKIMEKGEQTGQPGDLDEVLVKYQVMLVDGSVVAKTLEVVKFYMKDGHFCPALPKAIKTMKRGEKVNLIVQPQYAFGEGGRDPDNEFPAIPPSSMLSIDLELVSFYPVIDVTVKYTAKLEDGTIFEKKGFDEKGPLEFITDEEQVIVGLDRAASTMKKGERAILTIASEYGFGGTEVKQDLAEVPPCSTIIYEVEMLEFTKERAPWEMSDQEKIEAAGRKKEEGNILFKNGNYQRACKKYDKAADYVSDDGSFGYNDQKQVRALRISCWLNGAACGLKLNDYHEVIQLCSKVLDIEFYNVKALYRRAQAYMETADLHLAELDIMKALEADPQNREVKSIQKKLKQLQAESDKRDARLYMNMFACTMKDTSAVTKRLRVEKEENNKRDEDPVSMEMRKVDVSSAHPDDGMVIESS